MVCILSHYPLLSFPLSSPFFSPLLSSLLPSTSVQPFHFYRAHRFNTSLRLILILILTLPPRTHAHAHAHARLPLQERELFSSLASLSCVRRSRTCIRYVSSGVALYREDRVRTVVWEIGSSGCLRGGWLGKRWCVVSSVYFGLGCYLFSLCFLDSSLLNL
jgi:hypothetical protein